jgi:putative two-component system response regulator
VVKTQKHKRKIFLVDSDVCIQRSGNELLKPFYDVYLAESVEQLFNLLETIQPDLILLDAKIPKESGYHRVKKLKANCFFGDIPIVLLVTKSDAERELRCFDLGVVSYIFKPFSSFLFIARIEQILLLNQRELTQRRTDSLFGTVNQKAVEALYHSSTVLNKVADSVKLHGSLSDKHVTRVNLLLEALFPKLACSKMYSDVLVDWDISFILLSAQFYDIGKLAIPDAIANKLEPLESQEFEIVKGHVTIGVEVVKRVMADTSDHALLLCILNTVSSHHEKWDGTGYPAKLKGENIPLEGRVLAIVDTYDALISWRPYRRALSHEEAVRIIREHRGTHFDPILVDIFLEIESEFERIAVGCSPPVV